MKEELEDLMMSFGIIDDLKCCGNCKHRHTNDQGSYYYEACLISLKSSHKICGKWEYDELKREDRYEEVGDEIIRF